MSSSTIRSAVDLTIGGNHFGKASVALRQIVVSEWRQSGRADLVHALRQHPPLRRDKSLLLNLAIEEYKANSSSSAGIDLERQCHRFREFGSSIERSIFRQLEAQRYLDSNPGLLELFSTPEWPKVGDLFGEFQVLEELGVGSAAHVYLCLQADVGFRQVVIKVTPFSSFEAAILGRLNHPSIIRIYSAGSVDECNLNFLCMPFCGRSTLGDLLDIAFQDGCPRQDTCIASAAKRWMRDDEFPVEKPRQRFKSTFFRRTYVDGILYLAVQIADALHAAHERGILHGDLKPSNVLLTADARPLLLDFNLSKDFVQAPEMCGGTLPYMPPEYLRVLARHAKLQRDAVFNATPDIYSFGALLYELLTGKAPVNLSESVSDSSVAAELMLAQLEHGVPKICEQNRFVSRNLESIVLRCLAADASDRPSTIAEVGKSLQAESKSLSALGRTARLRPVFFASVVGLPLAVLGGVGAYISVQPERYVVDYDRGLQLASIGKLDEAAERFNAAVDSNPSFVPARFQLARTRLALGDVNAALKDFNQLARHDGDVRSMAYVGYCFNKKAAPEAAVLWYERAIEKGFTSASVYNNLGASYIEARPRISKTEQLRRAEYYLNKALALDPTSTTIQLNLVRRSTRESSINSGFDPSHVWVNAWNILKIAPDNPAVEAEVTAWYRAVLEFAAVSKNRVPISREQVTEREVFAELVRTADLSHDDASVETAAPIVAPGNSQALSPADSYFLEPDSIKILR